MIFLAVLTTSQMGTPTKRDAATNPPKIKAKNVSHSEEVGGLGRIDVGGRSILTLIVVSGAQTSKIITRTTSANPLSFSQPDFVILRPNNFPIPIESRQRANILLEHARPLNAVCRLGQRRGGMTATR